MQVRVPSAEVPATTGTRPPTRSRTFCSTAARSCSSRRATSPVTPRAVSPLTPDLMNRSTTVCWLAGSKSPESVNAVGIMEYTPSKAIKKEMICHDKKEHEIQHWLRARRRVHPDRRLRSAQQQKIFRILHDADVSLDADDLDHGICRNVAVDQLCPARHRMRKPDLHCDAHGHDWRNRHVRRQLCA